MALAFVAYGPLLWMFFRQQWQKPHYQYFPFVFGAFAWLLAYRYAHGERREEPLVRRRWIDWGILAISVGLLTASIYPLHSPWGAAASLILLAAYFCRVLSRSVKIPYLWGIWALLWLTIPMPLNLDQRLIVYLQLKSSHISSYVLDLLGVNHVMEGNTLWTPAKQLFVDEACSGIVSILSVVACALVYGVFKNRSPAHLVLLALAGVGWATAINIVRISTIAFVLNAWGVDWSEGTSHEVLSLALFMVTFLALLSTDQLLVASLAPIHAVWHEVNSQEMRYGRWLAVAWDAILGWGQPEPAIAAAPPPGAVRRVIGRTPRFAPALLVAALAAPAGVQAGLLGYMARIAPENLDVLPRALAVQSADLPATIGTLDQVDFQAHQRSKDHIFGRYSRTYAYRDRESGATFLASLDFPFIGGWHELTVCYMSSGWTGVERHIRQSPDDDLDAKGEPWQFVEADFEKPGGEHGAVFFAEFDQTGAPIRPQPGWVDTGYSYIETRNIHLSERHAFQAQVWVARTGVISPEDRETAVKLLLEVRRRFRDQIVEPPNAQSPATLQPASS